LSKEDEMLPERTFRDPIPFGVAEGQRLERKQLEKMLKEYYMLRGWNENGIPEKEKLKQLRLEFLIS
jgi:aldehyde:ferredoxin oxidoreductase